eukprot:SAG31_NODE_42409_length_271_cov_4.627907_1_plen_35_part_01
MTLLRRDPSRLDFPQAWLVPELLGRQIEPGHAGGL